jgi:MFS family permease
VTRGGIFAGRLGGIGEAFADRNFRIYSIGSVLSWLSFFVQAVAVSWTAWELTHSTTWLAAVALLDIAPNLIFIPLGGVLADRFDRYAIMMVSYVAALLQALALTVLAYGGLLSIGVLATLSFLHGLIHSFGIPATYGLLPRFIAREKLSSAIAVAAAFTQFAVFAGPALAGWITSISVRPPLMPAMSWATPSFLSPPCSSARRTITFRPLRAGVPSSATRSRAFAMSSATRAFRRCSS